MSGREQIEDIKERLDIVTVVSKYITLKNTGQNFSANCPFHQEKTPSFIVSPTLQRYKCFGCGKSGDIFNFVQEIENLDFPETLEKLAKEAGVELVKKQTFSPYQKLEEINQITADYYYQELKTPIAKSAVDYLKSRNFLPQTVKEFQIGFASGDGKLLKKLQSKFSNADLLASGEFITRNGQIVEKFKNRIMFPIYSLRGKVIGFSGRQTPGNDLGPKYLNTPETPIFKKRENLYGLNFAKNFIRKENLAILVEGQPDVVKAHQFGLKNLIAPLGTSLTQQQVELLKQYSSNVLMIFDNDSAGQKALERAFELFVQNGMNVYISNPAPFKDFDEMLDEKGSKAIKLIDQKQEAFEYLLRNFIKDLDITQYENIQKSLKFYERITSQVLHATYKDYCAATFEKMTNIRLQRRETSSSQDTQVHTQPADKLKKKEKTLYFLYLVYKYGFPENLELELETFTDPRASEILEVLMERGKKEIQYEELISQIKSDEAVKLIETIELTKDRVNSENVSDSEIFNVYRNIKKDYLLNKLKTLRKELVVYENDEEKSEEITDQIVKLTVQINDISKGS